MIIYSNEVLTHYHTAPHFDALKICSCGKHCEKRRNSHNIFKQLFNPFPNKPWFLHVCSTSLLKYLWENEKLLIRSNFSFSHSVFCLFGELSAIFNKFDIVVYQLFQVERLLNLLFGKRLNKIYYSITTQYHILTH